MAHRSVNARGNVVPSCAFLDGPCVPSTVIGERLHDRQKWVVFRWSGLGQPRINADADAAAALASNPYETAGHLATLPKGLGSAA